jgi:large subunit ribosomal protein L23
MTTVLIRPILSEKALNAEANGTYTFEVAREATKIQVKQAITSLYGVTPKKVRMMNIEGKKTLFRRVRGSRSAYKKAIVTLPKGKTISIHEGV